MLTIVKKTIKIILIANLIYLASCVNLYRTNITQGNILRIEQIQKIKIGMTKKQVTDILGSPILIDTFHNNQWDYINKSIHYDKDSFDYHLRLIFNKNILSDIQKINIDNIVNSQ